MITGHIVIRNGFKYDYPWVEAIESILPAVEKFIICEAYSEDGTYEKCLSLAKKHKKIKLIRGLWAPQTEEEKTRPYFCLSRLTNKCIEHVDTEWHIQIQGDECIHERDIEVLKNIPESLKNDPGLKAVSFPYFHFVANYSTTFPFMYDKAIRMARKSSGWRSVGDACQLSGDSGIHYASVPFYHYGKVHSSNLAMLKEKDFQNMFTALGFPDKKLAEMGEGVDYFYLFEDAYSKGLFSEFTGSHPSAMKKRIAKAKKDGWEQFPNKELKETT